MPATAKPVAANAASVMCNVCWNAAGFSMAAMGSTFVTWPPMSSKPAGEFIHALAVTTKTPEAVPLTATATPDQMCARGEIRSQP